MSYNIQWSPEVLSPLEKSSKILSDIPNHSIDSWLLGCFIWTIYNQEIQNSNFDRNRLKDLKKLPTSLKEEYSKLLNGPPQARLTGELFLKSTFFNNFFVETCLFLENLTIKDSLDKERFFKSLPKFIEQFPDVILKYKILPLITTGIDFGSTDYNALPIVFKISSKLSQEDYKLNLVPSLLKWFTISDKSLRISLLENLEIMAVHFDSNQVTNLIWPHFVQGFNDGLPKLRELTMKSLIFLAPKLSDKIVNGEMLKYLATLQMDPIPGIRANSTVCLGKLASLLNAKTRQKILVPALSRALQDPFSPSKQSSISAFLICISLGFIQNPDIALKIIPFISPLTIDPDISVRKSAFSALSFFLNYLNEQNDRVLDPSIQNKKESISKEPSSNVLNWAIGKVLGSEPLNESNTFNTNSSKQTTADLSTRILSNSSETLKKPQALDSLSFNIETSTDSFDQWDINFDPLKNQKYENIDSKIKSEDTNSGWEDDFDVPINEISLKSHNFSNSRFG